MKALICEEPGTFKYIDIDKPVPSTGYSILRVRNVGICGTDCHAFQGTQPFFDYPRVFGHELAAEIVQTDHPHFRVGAAVTIIPYFYCGECIACRNGKENCCSTIKVLGVHMDGGMCGYISVPDYALVDGEGLSYQELAMVEPLAIGAHAVCRAAICQDEYVLVIGAGPIGLGVMDFARIAGGKVIAVDTNDDRLIFCKERLGVAYTINPMKEYVLMALQMITNYDMPMVVIDATGNQKAINTGFKYMGHGGRYVLVGLQKGDISFSHPEFHKKEGMLMSSRNANRADFVHVVESIKKGRVKPVDYITHQVNFTKVKDEFASFLDVENGVIKAMIYFG